LFDPSTVLPAEPCTISMQHRRERGAAAVFAKGVCAGTIESRKGNAKDAPTPRKIVRRERCFLVTNMPLYSPT
jgi:hypothetical protein